MLTSKGVNRIKRKLNILYDKLAKFVYEKYYLFLKLYKLQ